MLTGWPGYTKHQISVFISPEYILSYSIYSVAHLSWHSTGANELWMVDLGFLLPFPFKVSFLKFRMMNFGGQDFGFLLFWSHFPFNHSFSTTSKNTLWMVDLGFFTSPIPLSFQSFLSRSVQTWVLEGRSWILAFSHPILLSKFLFGKAQRMNFGWVDVEEGAGALHIHTYLPASVENFNILRL